MDKRGFWITWTSDGSRVRGPTTPEERLFAAILEQAIADVRLSQACDGKVRWIAADACAWLRGSKGLVPFADVCALFGLSADAVREQVLGPPNHTAQPAKRDRLSELPTST